MAQPLASYCDRGAVPSSVQSHWSRARQEVAGARPLTQQMSWQIKALTLGKLVEAMDALRIPRTSLLIQRRGLHRKE